MGFRLIVLCQYLMSVFFIFNCQPVLNDFMATGHAAWKEARARLQELLSVENNEIKSNTDLFAKYVRRQHSSLFISADITVEAPKFIKKNR